MTIKCAECGKIIKGKGKCKCGSVHGIDSKTKKLISIWEPSSKGKKVNKSLKWPKELGF